MVNVSTAALIPSTYSQMKKLATETGVKLAEQEFHCRGQFTALHSGHPNTADLRAVKEFAKKVVQ